MQALIDSNRTAYDQNKLSIKVKNKFVNFLFENVPIEEVSLHKTIIFYLVAFVIFLGMTIFLFVEVGSVKEINVEYYNPNSSICFGKSSCQYLVQVKEPMEGPVYLMYYISNSVVNQATSTGMKRSISQAKTGINSKETKYRRFEARSCYPKITNEEMGKTKSWDNSTKLAADAIASPCGLLANNFLNDTCTLNMINETDYTNTDSISINENNIQWEDDMGQLFNQAPDSRKIQWINVNNPHFQVWMRTSGIPNFRKPWGVIQEGLAEATYRLTIQIDNSNNFWKRKKRGIILTTSGRAHGKNFLLPISFLLISMICLGAALFFMWRVRTLAALGSLKE